MEKESMIITLHESISDINNSLTYNYNLSQLFFLNDFCKTLFLKKIGIPTEKNTCTLISKKDLEFFAYKIIETSPPNIYLLILISEKACFKLDHTEDLKRYYGFRCKFALINNYKFEQLFKDIFKDDIEETFDKNDIVYLPIKIEKITIKLEKTD